MSESAKASRGQGFSADPKGFGTAIKPNDIPGAYGCWKFQCQACHQTLLTGNVGEGMELEVQCWRKHCHHKTRFVCPAIA